GRVAGRTGIVVATCVAGDFVRRRGVACVWVSDRSHPASDTASGNNSTARTIHSLGTTRRAEADAIVRIDRSTRVAGVIRPPLSDKPAQYLPCPAQLHPAR